MDIKLLMPALIKKPIKIILSIRITIATKTTALIFKVLQFRINSPESKATSFFIVKQTILAKNNCFIW